MPPAAAAAQLFKGADHFFDLLKAFRVGEAFIADDFPDAVQGMILDGVHERFQIHALERGEFHADILLGEHLAEDLEV